MIEAADYVCQFIYRRVEKPFDGYAIIFGNSEHGYLLPDDIEILKVVWRKAIHMSKYRTFGDVTLLYKNKLIRTMHNADEKCTYKTQFCYHVNKYKYE